MTVCLKIGLWRDVTLMKIFDDFGWDYFGMHFNLRILIDSKNKRNTLDYSYLPLLFKYSTQPLHFFVALIDWAS